MSKGGYRLRETEVWLFEEVWEFYGRDEGSGVWNSAPAVARLMTMVHSVTAG